MKIVAPKLVRNSRVFEFFQLNWNISEGKMGLLLILVEDA